VYVVSQDQCAWAIGNLAGGGDACREMLCAQGAVVPLVNLLKVFRVWHFYTLFILCYMFSNM